ncbi:MAG: Na(+)/H(+) antiporter subunit B [Proteobacteria bacterium]|nr:Na(+)/H(+) antiporter subunit B [Pseudomonadota bacterium]MDA1307985.1 Na(+)/H(+) antiporter subunit B [Pseudomonadota bacterium]
MKHHLILRVVSKLLIPFILLFALYVQFHGDYGPGGGFQAGVLFASAFILYALIFGVDNAREVLPSKALRFLVPVGLIIYALTGFAGIVMGGKFLDYDVLAQDPQHGQHLGILVIEFGVGTTVAAVMVTIFYAYAGRTRDVDDEDW